jgi:hypothetical protein
MAFNRGRTDIKGQCGCMWSHVEPGVDEARQPEVYDEVRALVVKHAETLGHSPTIVVIRERWYAQGPDDIEDELAGFGLEEALAETS